MDSKRLHEDISDEEQVTSQEGSQSIDSNIRMEDNGRSTRDATQLIAVFPEEVWTLISERISGPGPDNIQNFSNSSPFFRNLLFQKRTLFLFPKVWNILSVWYHQNRESQSLTTLQSTPRKPRIRCGACPRSRCTQWYSEILKCRLVCKKWCDTIDQFYGNLPVVLTEENMYRKTCRWLKNEFSLSHPREMRAFIEHFECTHIPNENGICERNPFVGRRLHLDFSFWRVNNILPEFINILRIYGHHISHSEMNRYPEHGGQSWIEWYTFLSQIFQSMPNLRSAIIAGQQFEVGQHNMESVSPEELEQFNREKVLNPLPRLEGLQCLQMKDVVAPVFKELIVRNNHITKLGIMHSCVNFINLEHDLFTCSLPNLKKLGIRISKVEVFNSLERADNRFLLEELRIDLQNIYNLEWSRVFSVLENKWGSTLKTVALQLPQKRDMERGTNNMPLRTEVAAVILPESLNLRLNLPQVTHLKLGIPKLASLDFILPMKESLETMEVDTGSFRVDRKMRSHLIMKYQQQKTQFVGWTEELNDSNIWTIFPKLKEIKTGDYSRLRDTWTREKWEELNKIKAGLVWE